MSRQGTIGRAAGWAVRLATTLGAVLAPGLAPAPVRAQGPAPLTTAPGGPGVAVTTEVGVSVLPPEIQVVRFQIPEGAHVEILGPGPESVVEGNGPGPASYGLKVGVGYHLRLWDLPDHPGVELYPVVEIVGHLHRPAGMDPARFPVRVIFNLDDFADVVDRGRLVTKVVYLEDPDQALPLSLPKDQIPVATLNPAEEPLKVAAALGRVMAIVRLGGRKPSVDELNALNGAGIGPMGGPPCPFAGPDGGRCPVPCGPVRGTAPPAGRPWMPRDEFLCDGGDHAELAHFGGDGGLAGIDPRDAVVRFNTGDRPRILPTNLVCVYAPRFAEVRVGIGPNENLTIQRASRTEFVERQEMTAGKLNLKRLVQNEGAEAARVRERASGLAGRVFAGAHAELRVLNGFDTTTHLAGRVQTEGVELARNRLKLAQTKEKLHFLGINVAEGAAVTGLIEGAGQTVVTWRPSEAVGVEAPPLKPGLVVLKRVSAGEAEPGAVLTFVIQFRNMGNTTIGAVSVVDSLLPRLVYVPGSAQGPKGTVFTAGDNRAASTELRWDLPGVLYPGAEGSVSFQATVR